MLDPAVLERRRKSTAAIVARQLAPVHVSESLAGQKVPCQFRIDQESYTILHCVQFRGSPLSHLVLALHEMSCFILDLLSSMLSSNELVGRDIPQHLREF